MRQPTSLNPACEIAGCPNRARTRKGGLCSAHHERRRRTGDVMAEVPVKQHRTGCTVEGCGRRHYSFGLCELHRGRMQATGSVRAADPARVKLATQVDPEGRRYCYGCCRFLDVEAFHRLSNRCIRCRAAAHFRMNAAEWETLLASQDGRCAVCGTADPGQGWHTDHDHRCCPGSRNTCGRCVRGILCSACNTAIGLMQDNPDRMRQAATYLEEHAGRESDEASPAEDPRPAEDLG